MKLSTSTARGGDERERNLGSSGGEEMVREFAGETKFMHNPIGFLAFGSSASVENKGLLHSNQGVGF